MPWPDRPWWLPIRLELSLGADQAGDPAEWSWTDVSGDVRPQTITIRRGRSDEGAQVQPLSASIDLDNATGDYTPGLPTGAHYPLIRRGVPARLWVQAGGPHVLVPDARGAMASTPSSPDLDLDGDLDVRVEVALDRVTAQAKAEDEPLTGGSIAQALIGRYRREPGSLGWRLYLSGVGVPILSWSEDGAIDAATWHEIFATAAVPAICGQRFGLRATLDVDNGAGGWTVTFYVGPTVTGPWRQLGQAVHGAEPTVVHNAPEPLRLGDLDPVMAPGAGRWIGIDVRRGIDGEPIAQADFTQLAPGQTEFVDTVGRPWQLTGSVEVTDWVRRAVGHVDEWAPTWPWGDLSDPATGYQGEATTSITIAGTLRRLGQGQPPLQSVLRRRIPSQPVLAYWPLEDGPGATQAASGISEGRPAQISNMRMGANSGLPSSAPLPTTEAGALLVAPLPTLPDQSLGWRVEMVYYLDELPTERAGWIRVDTSGGGIAQIVGYIGGNEARIRLLDDEGGIVSENWWGLPSAAQALAAATSGWCRVRLVAVPMTGGWDYRLWWTPIGTNESWYTNTGFVGAQPFTRPTRLNSLWNTLTNMPIGHVTYVNDPATDVYGGGTGGPDTAYLGERALVRMRRLAQEEQLPISVPGYLTDSPRMGPQRIDTLLGLLQECADADGGILLERREVAGLQYIATQLLYEQDHRLELSARSNEIASPFSPVLDDQRIRNDVTVRREGGSEARATDEQSIAESGLYDESVTLNLADDAVLPNIAAWRLHLGTLPGMRYPQLTTDLTIAPQQVLPWLDIDSGSRVRVADLPPQHPQGDVELMVEGYTETLTPTRWEITANASPGSVWDVGEVESDEYGRVDSDTSVLAAPVDAATSTLIVHTPDSLPWVTAAAPLNTNGDFEESAAGWTGVGATITRVMSPGDRPLPFTGQWSLHVVPDGVTEHPSAGSDQAPIAPDRLHTLTGWLYSAEPQLVSLNVNWFDESGTYLSTSSNDQQLTARTWTWFEATTRAPAAAATANIAPTIPNTPPVTAELWADELYLRPTLPGHLPTDLPLTAQLGGEHVRVRGIEPGMWDSYDRALEGTWGVADSGPTWIETGGAPEDRAVNTAAGLIVLGAAPTSIRYQRLPGQISNCEIRVMTAVSAIATGAAIAPAVLLRHVTSTDCYRVRLHYEPGGTLAISTARGGTQVGTTTAVPYRYTAGQGIHIRIRIDGQRIRARAWPDGVLEPTHRWHHDTTVTTDPIPAGEVGLTASALTGNTNAAPVIGFNAFQIVSPQRWTVDRSHNHVIKPHAAGTPVTLAQPAIVAW